MLATGKVWSRAHPFGALAGPLSQLRSGARALALMAPREARGGIQRIRKSARLLAKLPGASPSRPMEIIDVEVIDLTQDDDSGDEGASCAKAPVKICSSELAPHDLALLQQGRWLNDEVHLRNSLTLT